MISSRILDSPATPTLICEIGAEFAVVVTYKGSLGLARSKFGIIAQSRNARVGCELVQTGGLSGSFREFPPLDSIGISRCSPGVGACALQGVRPGSSRCSLSDTAGVCVTE